MQDNNKTFRRKQSKQVVKEFILVSWIRYHSDAQKACRDCKISPARFTYDAYGYENIALDIEKWDKALHEQSTGQAKSDAREDARLFIHKLYEAQKLGDYLVVGKMDLCGECFASLADAFTARDNIGAYTITELLSSAGNVSCVFGWGILSGYYENNRVPLLLHTKAHTLDELLSSLKNPRLDVP